MAARIVKMSDQSEELFASFEAAKEAYLRLINRWRAQGWEVKEHEQDNFRCSVTDDSGQYIDDFYID